MKTFKDYLAESEHHSNNPVVGDVFELNLKEDTLIESYVVESDEHKIVLASDQRMIDILESFGYEVEDVCEGCGESACECVSTNYQLPMEDGTGGQMFGNTLEEDEDPPAYRAILNRIMMQHPTLLATYGPEAVMDAAHEEAMFWSGDEDDELGTSDVSALVRRVEQALQHSYDGRELDEVAGDVTWKELDRVTRLERLRDHAKRQGNTEEFEKLDAEIKDIYSRPTIEAKYQGREVPLNKPMKGDVKKSKVYVKDPKTGNIKKVNFGDKNMRIKKSIPGRRKSFRARHNCDNPGPKTKARYWSCRAW